jgi:hypothetical protein
MKNGSTKSVTWLTILCQMNWKQINCNTAIVEDVGINKFNKFMNSCFNKIVYLKQWSKREDY